MKSKLEQLAGLVNPAVKIKNLLRLVDGDLAHIGDAIIAGKEIKQECDCVLLTEMYFSFLPDLYTIKQEMRSLNGYEYPAPEAQPLEFEAPYYIPDFVYGGCVKSVWRGDPIHPARLKAGLVHLSENNATAHTDAYTKACGGEV